MVFLVIWLTDWLFDCCVVLPMKDSQPLSPMYWCSVRLNPERVCIYRSEVDVENCLPLRCQSLISAGTDCRALLLLYNPRLCSSVLGLNRNSTSMVRNIKMQAENDSTWHIRTEQKVGHSHNPMARPALGFAPGVINFHIELFNLLIVFEWRLKI